MIRWILQGILRDKNRSLFPFLVVTAGVSLVVFTVGFMEGIFMGMIDSTANLDTGHLRFVNKPFYDEEHLNPLDRSLTAQNETREWLRENSDAEINWAPRIRWGAIADVPDENGETKSQTPIIGMALDLLSPESQELERLEAKIDKTQDLRRMLKCYGTAKPNGVTSRFFGNERIEDEALREYLLNIKLPERELGSLVLNVANELPGWFQGLLEKDKRVEELWAGKGKAVNTDTSGSGYDMTLLRKLLHLGYKNIDELSTILALRPEGSVKKSGKGERYLRTTLAKALMI